MEKHKLKDFKDGWFIGNFQPSLLNTKEFEVSFKQHKKNERVQKHYHKLTTEFTLVVRGKARLNGKIYKVGDIIVIKPNEIISGEILEDYDCVVVRNGSVKGDKY